MGWSYSNTSKPWNTTKKHRDNWGWGQAKPKASWGPWRCQCGNENTGNQCVHCHSKWWEVQWEKVEAAKPAAASDRKASGKGVGKPKAKPGLDILAFLDKFLGTKVEEAQDFAKLHTLATELREGLAPPQQKKSC